jgi:hypothetical protein
MVPALVPDPVPVSVVNVPPVRERVAVAAVTMLLTVTLAALVTV